MSSLRIGYFTDIHLREKVPGTAGPERRKSRLMKARLEECMATFRREGIDLLVCTGDIVDEAHPSVPEDLAIIRNIIDTLPVPNIMIPGNHDPYPGVFYEVFQRPEFLEIMGRYRIINCIDHCEPHENACRRSETSIKRMAAILQSDPEDVDLTITFQHYEIWPEHPGGYPYNYKNDAEIRKALETSKKPVLAISGHYHKGIAPTVLNGVTYFAGKALCEEPFPCYIIELAGPKFTIREITWKPPKADSSAAPRND